MGLSMQTVSCSRSRPTRRLPVFGMLYSVGGVMLEILDSLGVVLRVYSFTRIVSGCETGGVNPFIPVNSESVTSTVDDTFCFLAILAAHCAS